MTDSKRTPIGKFIHTTWINLNIRAGKYKHLQTKSKNKCYKNIQIEFTREEFKNWCYKNEEIILKLKRPSLDRIDSSKNYNFNNIQILELNENIKKKRSGNNYKNGPKSNIKRGVKLTKNNKYLARIVFNCKEKYIGTFNTEKEALIAFRNEYFKLRGKYPFDI